MPMITGLIFFRHSLPVIDPAIPAREWHLSEEGRQRCKRLSEQLAYFKPQQIVSSLEPKALETAQILANSLGMPFDSAEGLHEHARSHVEYTNQEPFEASVKAFFEQPNRLVYGDETADQTYARFTYAVSSIQERYPSQTPLVVVTHGTVISLFVSRACGVDPFSLWKSLKLPCMVVFSAHKPNLISSESSTSFPTPIP